LLEGGEISETLSSLQNHKNICLAINSSLPKQMREVHDDLVKGLARTGFKPFSQRTSPKEWLDTRAQNCFQALSGHKLLPRRTLEGRLQRAAILFEQGLQIRDPVDVFEEITRYKLIQGNLPLEDLASSKELDALVTAYFAWRVLNRPGQMVVQGEFVLPGGE
jgi:hypothetical protein